MRYEKAILGSGYFTRGGFLDYYGRINGIARWERAAVYESGDDADGSNNVAGDAEGSDEYSDGAVGPHDDADYAAASDAYAEAAGGLAGSVAAGDDAYRVTNPGRALCFGKTMRKTGKAKILVSLS